MLPFLSSWSSIPGTNDGDGGASGNRHGGGIGHTLLWGDGGGNSGGCSCDLDYLEFISGSRGSGVVIISYPL